MQSETTKTAHNKSFRAPTARYLPSEDLEMIIQLLLEVRDTTLLQASYTQATRMLIKLGAEDRLSISGSSPET